MVTYYEFAQSMSPGSAGFGMEGGSATLLIDVAAADLEDAITSFLGSAEASGTGYITRTLPVAHPQFPWLFADRISSIQGLKPTSKTAADDTLEAPPLSHYQQYERYRLTVNFTPRFYSVMPDSKINSSALTYYDEDGGTVNTTAFNEWERFTDYDVQPQPQEITAQYGQMKFEVASGAAPNTNSFHGSPRIIIPKATIRFRWFQVPFSYLDHADSYLTKYLGYINQSAWYGWPAGSLLFMGVTAKRYTPPIPDRGVEEGGTFISIAKLCDLELIFEFTERTIGAAATSPANANFIAAGHNLMPWIQTRKFYYVISNTNNTPTYFSVPFQLLFQDPAL